MKPKRNDRVTVYLVKTVTTPPALRTKSFTGRLAAPPKVGERMVIVGRGLEDRDVERMVSTSPVLEIKVKPKSTLVFTQNSVYRLRKS